MYMWVTFRITQENMSDAPPLSGRALSAYTVSVNFLNIVPKLEVHNAYYKSHMDNINLIYEMYH